MEVAVITTDRTDMGMATRIVGNGTTCETISTAGSRMGTNLATLGGTNLALEDHIAMNLA